MRCNAKPKLLKIVFGGKVRYEALLNEHAGKLYYRTLGDDKFSCEAMLDELIDGEYIKATETDKAYEITLADGSKCTRNITDYSTVQISTISELGAFLTNKNIQHEVTEYQGAAFSITFNGRELLPGVTSIYNSNRMSSFASSLLKTTNNADYDPFLEEEASSYRLNIYDSNFKSDSFKNLIEELKQGHIKYENYFSDANYKRLIKDIENLYSLHTLENITVSVDGAEFVVITQTDLHNLKKNIAAMFKSKPYEENVSSSEITALDERNLSFKFKNGNGNILHAHVNKANFDKISLAKTKHSNIKLAGYYTKDKSIWFETVTIVS